MQEPATTATLGGHVVLCGLNELGYRTLEELTRLGEQVVAVARAPEEELAGGATALGAILVDGSYRDESVLRAAGVPAAGALVVTEDDDVGNLHAALAAQDLNPDLRIRLRLFNQELGRRAEELFSVASSGWTLHQLRHSALTHLAEADVGLPLLMAKSRHISLRSLQRYARPGAEAVAALTAATDPARRRHPPPRPP